MPATRIGCNRCSAPRSPYGVAEAADALVLVTDFAQIRSLTRMPVLFDGRNTYDGRQLAELGFSTAASAGRPWGVVWSAQPDRLPRHFIVR